ncbi:hypothetical protein [Halobacillus campisalis]
MNSKAVVHRNSVKQQAVDRMTNQIKELRRMYIDGLAIHKQIR